MINSKLQISRFRRYLLQILCVHILLTKYYNYFLKTEILNRKCWKEEFIIRLRLNEHVKIPQEGRLTGAAGQPVRLPLPN